MKTRAPTVIICLSPYHGGMEMDAIQTAYLLQEHADVSIILKQGSPSERLYRNDLEAGGIRVFSITFRNAFSPTIIRDTRKIITRNNIRNVIFFGSSELRSLYFALWRLPTNLIVRHGTTKFSTKKDPLHRLIYSRVSWHVTISKHLAENVRQIFPFGKNSRLKIIYSSLRKPVNNHSLCLRKPNEPVEILHVGRLTSGKGQIDAIQACAALHRLGIPFHLNLVGEIEPQFHKQATEAISSTPYRDNIKCIGHVSDPRPWYRKSHIFLFPSHGEGLGNAFIEALAHGLVCIAYDNTAFPELLELGFKFMLAKHLDTQDLSQCLLQAVNQISDITTRRENQALAQGIFSPQHESSEYLQILI